MKTKAQKQESVKKGETLFGKSEAVLLIDFAKVRTADLRLLREELKKAGSPLFVMKKRLLELVLKKNDLVWQSREMKTQVGAVFASSLEAASASVYKFFKGLEKEKKVDSVKILGGFDLKKKLFMAAPEVTAIGALPPREILLAQLAMLIQAPVKQLLYVLDQKAHLMGSGQEKQSK
ncbi:MAG TPA: 50S ribosomal protein L10 [Candidatus Paceibacterota bacterium]|nr:50S ribosomal protein L10 [Candidatus Paceibacterota bacterium]